jgi:alpha-ketoglutarate-dependent taurine dioxygenase
MLCFISAAGWITVSGSTVPGPQERTEVRVMRQVADDSAYRILTVRPLTGALGAQLSGVDLSKPLSAAAQEEIRRALYDHLVIYFHDQPGFTRERHLELARMFGALQRIPHIFSVDGYPDVQIVRREPGESRRYVGEGFHADSTFMTTPPTTVTMHCIEAPEVGGDTVFANLQLAYETLSPGMQKLLGGLRAVHSASRLFGSQGADPSQVMMKKMAVAEGDAEVTHPVVRTHPGSGRKGLFVHSAYTQRIDGLTPEESAPLLQFLYQHAARIEFTCRVRWRKHMVLVWDNRSTHHSAIGDYDALRYIERVTTGGETPV